MDNKAKGLSTEILATALRQANEGREFIMSRMMDAIDAPRENLKDFAPRILTVKIPQDKIRDVIGQGGKVVRGIQEETGAHIDIQEDGTIFVASRDQGGEEARRRIELIVKEPEIGEKFTGRVVSIQSFGAFIELIPGKDGLLHISRVANGRVGSVEDVLTVGDEVEVEVLDIDDRGKISLDRINKPDAPPSSGGSGGSGDDKGGDRGGRDRGGTRRRRSQAPSAPLVGSHAVFYRQTVLDNGVTVLTESIDTVRSVALGIWFAVGSRDESEPEAGMSHFMEHMMFKGTPTRSAAEISESFDELGAELNAFTSKEYTCYYARLVDEHLPIAAEILSDMVTSALLEDDACEREREVVIEEIARMEDTPDDQVHEIFSQALWPGHPIGLPILGSRADGGLVRPRPLGGVSPQALPHRQLRRCCRRPRRS